MTSSSHVGNAAARRRHGRVAPLAVVLAVLAGGCGGEDERVRGTNTTSRPSSTQQADRRALTLYTHCGVWSAQGNGRLWLAAPPLHDGSHNPLPGWDDNETHGEWRELGDGEAEFRADSGKIAHFVPALPGQEDPARGCE